MGGIGRAGDGRISLRLVRIDSSIDRNRFLTIPASILIDTAYLESLPSLLQHLPVSSACHSPAPSSPSSILWVCTLAGYFQLWLPPGPSSPPE